jgi:iron complex outermembrane receptor protein
VRYRIGIQCLTDGNRTDPGDNMEIRRTTALSVGLLMSASVLAMAQATAARAADKPTAVSEVVITSSRIPVDLKSVPGSVTLIGRAKLDEQAQYSSDLGQILSATVPGLALASSGSASNSDQTLRGRAPAVFVDGVPISTPLRNGGRDLRVISPSAIDQIEVVRGATAVYGLGGAGGLINYVTRDPSSGPVQFQTDAAAGLSLTNPSGSGNWSIDQSASGRVGRFTFLASGYYESYSSLFDSSGNRLPPDPQLQGGIADTRSYSVFGKVGFDVTDDQHIYLSASTFKVEQKTGYSATPGLWDVTGATAVAVPPRGSPQYTHSNVYTGRYVIDDLAGSRVEFALYSADYASRFPFNPLPTFPPNGGQSEITSRKAGIRFDVNTPLKLFQRTGSLLWGLDAGKDNTAQPLTDGRYLVPHMKQTSVAPFAQFDVQATDWLNVRGGVRFEKSSVSVGGFTTIPLSTSSLGGVTVAGGKLNYEKALFNLGAVVHPFSGGPLEPFSVYGGYSQGFSVGDFGRALRATNSTSIAQFDFKPQIIDSYEVGLRVNYPSFRAQVAAYYNSSQLGSTFNAVTLALVRAPEHIWGYEVSFDGTPTGRFGWGGSLSWVNGRTQNTTTAVWSPLDDTRIPPLKATFYAQQDLSDRWRVRGQLTYSGSESRFPGNPRVFGRGDIAAFALADLSVSYRSELGVWTLAVNNLLNERYFTPDAYIYASNLNFTAGQGATARLTYSVKY